MAHILAWRNFRRAQDLTLVMATLIYAGAVLHAFQRLPGGAQMIAQRALLWPALFFALAFLLPLAFGALRRGLARYVWQSFLAGFGQSAGSIVVGIGLLGGAAAFMYWQISSAAHGGRYPAGVFSGYAAGIGVLAGQVVLVRLLQRDPGVRARIETPDASAAR